VPAYVRTIGTWVLGTLAVAALAAATVGVWVRFTVPDSDRFGAISTDLLDDPAVRAELADRVAAAVMAAGPVEEVAAALVDGPLERSSGLVPILGSTIESALSTRLEALLGDDRVQAIVGAAVLKAHEAVMALLRGDGLLDGLTVAEGQVRLNLLPLVGLGIGELQELGLLRDVDVPELAPGGDPATQIAELSAATGRDLPPDFGQLVVYESDRVDAATASLQQAQRAAAVGVRAAWLLVLLAVVLTGACVAVARDRWRTLLALALGVAATMIVLRAIVHRVADEAPSLAAGPAGVAAASIVIGSLGESLLRIAAVITLLAAAGVLVSLRRRGWRRSDLELVVAVAVGLGVITLFGITLGSIVLGLVSAVASVPLGRTVRSSPELISPPATSR